MKMMLGCLTEGFQFRFSCHALLAFLSLILPPIAKGGVTITVTETSGGVTISTNGSLNLAGLTRQGETFSNVPRVTPNEGKFSLGVASSGPISDIGDTYRANDDESITHPLSFGTGGVTNASFGTGLFFGFFVGSTGPVGGAPDLIQVPNDYSSGSPISSSATFNGETITSLGLTPGQYTWSWGEGGNADSITMTVPQPGSTPSSPNPVADNSAEKAQLSKAIKKLKKKAKAAKRKKNSAKAKKLLAKAKKLAKKLNSL